MKLAADELVALSRAYSWEDATSSLLYNGENATFLVETRGSRYAVRRYRQSDLSPIRAELAWIAALSGKVATPRVLPKRDKDLFMQLDAQVYAAFEYLEGHTVEDNTAANLYHLGHLLYTLHTAADEVSKQMPKHWLGWQRPLYDEEKVIERSLGSLLSADFLTSEDKARCERVAAELSKRWQPLTEKTFIHADLHFGNVLEQGDTWFCLDFDECGFGSRMFDLGVVKFHLMAENDLEFLPDFLSGYGAPISEQDLNLGTALRIFYTAGKIPSRLDIPELARNPRAVIQQYLRYLAW